MASISIMTVSVIFSIIVWLLTNDGNLVVQTANEDIVYKISGDTNEYQGENEFKNLGLGIYKIEAYGKNEGFYKPRSYEVEIKRKEKTKLIIFLEYNEKNPDFSGVEPDPFPEKN